jgi:gephyrin
MNQLTHRTSFYLFVLPALRLLGGYSKELCKLPYVKVKVGKDAFISGKD